MIALTSAYKGHNLVFIVGCPRSGTTWLQRLLAAHPRIRTGQESDLFDVYIGPQLRAWRDETIREADRKTATGRGGVGMSCYLREEDFLPILRDYMLRLLGPLVEGLGPDEVFVEKTPSHALYIPEILELLPESRFIHIVRDPRDVVASLMAAGRTWGSAWSSRLPLRAVRWWCQHVEAARRAAQKEAKGRLLEVTYEGLSADTSGTLSEVLRFIGMQWDDESVARAIAANSADVMKRGGGTAIPLGGDAARRIGNVVKEPRGFVRRGTPGGWRRDLSLPAKLCTWILAHRAMRRHGYRWSLLDLLGWRGRSPGLRHAQAEATSGVVAVAARGAEP